MGSAGHAVALPPTPATPEEETAQSCPVLQVLVAIGQGNVVPMDLFLMKQPFNFGFKNLLLRLMPWSFLFLKLKGPPFLTSAGACFGLGKTTTGPLEKHRGGLTH